MGLCSYGPHILNLVQKGPEYCGHWQSNIVFKKGSSRNDFSACSLAQMTLAMPWHWDIWLNSNVKYEAMSITVLVNCPHTKGTWNEPPPCSARQSPAERAFEHAHLEPNGTEHRTESWPWCRSRQRGRRGIARSLRPLSSILIPKRDFAGFTRTLRF